MKKTVHALLLGSLAAAAISSASISSAHADTPSGVHVTTNEANSATTQQPGGANSSVTGTMLAVAADGSGYVAEQALVGNVRGPVFTAASGASTILTSVAGGAFEVAEGQVVARNGTTITLYNETTGASATTAPLPAPLQGVRQVLDAVPVGDGVAVSVVDADPASTTGYIYGSSVWLYAGGTWTQQFAAPDGATVSALANRDGAVIAALVNVDTGLVSVMADGETAATTVTVPDNATAVEVAFDTTGVPVIVLSTPTGTTVSGVDGTVLATAAAGKRAFVSSAAPVAVTTVANRAVGTAVLSNVAKKVAYNGKTAPRASIKITTGGVVRTLGANVKATGGSNTTTASGAVRQVKSKTCFTAVPAAASTQFVTLKASGAACTGVEHLIKQGAYSKKKNTLAVTTSAKVLAIQVAKRGKWVTARIVKVGNVKVGATKKVTFKVPAKKIRIVAKATSANLVETQVVRVR